MFAVKIRLAKKRTDIYVLTARQDPLPPKYTNANVALYEALYLIVTLKLLPNDR